VSGGVFTINRPDADSMVNVLATGPAVIPDDGAGLISGDWPLPVKYAGAAPTAGDEMGSAANSFELTAGKAGFKVLAVDAAAGVALVIPTSAARWKANP
jgi:hypothetical protein